ncbi:MAG: phosphodiesterase, partial [Ruegeria sp.]
HRPISGTVTGIPFSTMRSVLYQAPPPRPEWNWDTFRPSQEAPNLGVVTIADTGVNLQFDQFCGFEVGGPD